MSQTRRVFNHLMSGKTITQLEAYQGAVGNPITRLGAVIYNIRQAGILVASRVERNPNTGTDWFRYYLPAAERKRVKSEGLGSRI
jgi:hypothetical protein